MDELHEISREGKISQSVTARLAQLSPTQVLRAIVVLKAEAKSGPAGRRPNRQERQKVIDEVRNSTSKSLQEIDAILTRFNGHRISKIPTAIGTIAVETTPAGIAALSKSDLVKAILPDQPISRVI